jgi:cysteinyl-tRNA synthetase
MENLRIPKLPIYFFNTETRRKELFQPAHQPVKMYTCGPTVYHFAHIGNFRTYVFEDILRKTLKFFGYQIIQVMNITDVDDKTIRGAMEKNVSLEEYTHPYKNAFFVDLQTLGIERAEYYPAATQYINYMIDFIQKLLDKGFAYKSNDKSIYYPIDKCPHYGRLSHLKLNELKVGAGDMCIAADEYDKENVGDFVLWKAYDAKRDGKIFWESPFGPGRPGWHLECSTMAMTLLGETLDIHVGGVDNIFPHHENEIAQSESCTGKPFVKYWLHSEHLVVNHKKMSKSLGNFFTLRDLLNKGYSGIEVRYLLVQSHYRTQLNFTFEGLDGAKTVLEKFNHFILRMQEVADTHTESTQGYIPILQNTLNQFAESLADDLNLSQALASVFDLMHEINQLYDQEVLTPKDAAGVLYVMEQINHVLGIFNFDTEGEIPQEMHNLLEKRTKARSERDWKLADQLRQEILNNGYVIEDTPHGPRLKKMKR